VREFRTLPEFPGIQIGRDGTIIGRSGQPIIAPAGRYISVPVRINGRATTIGAHVLVARAWVGPQPDGCEVAHRNRNTHDNHAENLRWATHADNCADKVEHGTVQHGERNGNRRFTEEDVRAIRLAADAGESFRSIARRFGTSHVNVGFIVRRETWAHVA